MNPMNSQILEWSTLIVLSLSLGALYIGFLSAHPLHMSWYLFGATLALCLLVVALIVLFAPKQLIIAIPVALACIVAGYAVAAQGVLSREDTRPVPEITRNKQDPGLGHTAVVYFTHGEPETYDPIGWINQFKEFDEQGISFVPFMVRPFFLFQLRKHYLIVGKSDHRSMHQQMLASLEQAYRAQGDDTTRFYLSFLDDNPRPDAAVIQALNEGASRIIVSEVFLTISNHTAEGKHLIDELHVEEYGVPIEYTGPMWDSDKLKSMFVHRANSQIGNTDKSKVGVLLVGHGQPDEWDVEWATETEQETRFRHDILDLFEQDGYRRENLGLAWMEFKEPKPAKKVSEFLENGVEQVLYYSAAISADAIHSQYDVPALVEETPVPDGFPLINLGAWNNDPLVIQAIKAKIDPFIE